MTANANIVVDPVKGNSTLVRPKFSPGLLLRDDDLKAGVDYTRELSRLLFQSLFGCGVVCGLQVTTEFKCGKLIVTVKRGVALNGKGDPIYVPDDKVINVDPSCGKEVPENIWVILCSTEKCCAPRSAMCGCEEDDSASVCTREQDWFEIKLKAKPDKCSCMCEEQRVPNPPSDGDKPPEPSQCWCADPCGCLKTHYAGECSCNCGDQDCVVLAVITDTSRDEDYKGSPLAKKAEADKNPWIANHSVRRFVRPVLMRDPVVFSERYPKFDPCAPQSQDQRPQQANSAASVAEQEAAPAEQKAPEHKEPSGTAERPESRVHPDRREEHEHFKVPEPHVLPEELEPPGKVKPPVPVEILERLAPAASVVEPASVELKKPVRSEAPRTARRVKAKPTPPKA